MPHLTHYDKSLPYSYALGIFPSMEMLLHAPQLVTRLLVSSKIEPSESVDRLYALCATNGVRVEQADKILSKISGKQNCFVAAVFQKQMTKLAKDKPHIVLHNISDKGNLGTVLRTALGFSFKDIAIIRPATDAFDPHVVRASMGAMAHIRLTVYDDFETYRSQYPTHSLFPFMLKGATTLQEASASPPPLFSLIFGNEGSGLPETFADCGNPVKIPHSSQIDSLNLSIAASIGMYAFAGGLT